MINKEIFEQLKPYKLHLGTAYKANYYRGILGNEIKELDKLYQKMFNQPSKLINGCSHCILNDLKRIGEEYFKFEAKQEEENTSTPTPTKVVEQPIKKSRTNNKTNKKSK